MLLPAEIATCLEPDEQVIWIGRPRPYVFMLRGITSIFYGMTWSILGAFWFHGAMLAPWEGWWQIVPWLSLPFILAGFSFFFYPINLGARGRRTWYIVTQRRALIARWHYKKPLEVRVFAREEMGPPQVVKRFDGLYEVILSRRAQDKPYLVPRLESGFFGIPDGEAAAAAVRKAMGQ